MDILACEFGQGLRVTGLFMGEVLGQDELGDADCWRRHHAVDAKKVVYFFRSGLSK